MALTKISTGGVKDDAASQAKIADEAIDEARLQVSNTGTNGQFLQKQSGDTGGLTWASVDVSGKADTTGTTFTGDVVFDGETAGKDITFDRSENSLKFANEAKAHFGQTTLFHNSVDLYIQNGVGDIRFQANGGEDSIYAKRDGAVEIWHGAGTASKKFETTAAGVTVTGTVSDNKGELRTIPLNINSSGYTLVAGDAGKCVTNTTGGWTVNNNIFSAGQAVTFINNGSGDQTITQGSGVTIYNTADAATGNRTLAARGMATLIFYNASTAYISGAGLS